MSERRFLICINGNKFLSLYGNVHNPKSVIRLLRANESIFLSSVSLLLGYNGPPIAPSK